MKYRFAHVIGGLLLSLAVLAGCARDAGPVRFHAQANPRLLSEWKVVRVDDGQLELNQGVVPFDLNTPLFSDYAHKLRTVWMPRGGAARYHASESFDFPVGTILSKTFYYPRVGKGSGDADAVARTYDHSRDHRGEGLDLRQVRMIETRLLVRRAHGWDALAYVWNEEQTQAELARTGASIPLQLVADDGSREAIDYQVPDQNQCAGCHASNNTTRAILPLGPKARHLNRDYAYAGGRENQLVHMARVGYLQGAPIVAQAPRNADWHDARASLDARARAYLDINCGHCHNARGAADTSGLLLDIDTPMGERLGRCKAPVAAGQGTGDRKFDIVPGRPDESILPYRMASTDPAEMMPELGRATAHREGVALIREWIAAQSGHCGSPSSYATPATP